MLSQHDYITLHTFQQFTAFPPSLPTHITLFLAEVPTVICSDWHCMPPLQDALLCDPTRQITGPKRGAQRAEVIWFV